MGETRNQVLSRLGLRIRMKADPESQIQTLGGRLNKGWIVTGKGFGWTKGKTKAADGAF